MPNLKINILSNFAGAGGIAVVQLLVVPVYLRQLGIEGYGLIGFFITLQGALRILELGLTPTVNRELARYSVQPELAHEARNFTRTFEVLSFTFALLVWAVVWVAAPTIAARWLQAEAIPDSTVVSAVRCMGLLTALQWPLNCYHGGLLGLQRQAVFNVIKGTMFALMGACGVLVLTMFEPSITLFFWSQIAVTALHVLITRAVLWRSLPRSSESPRIAAAQFVRAYRFAAGMTGIAICSIVVSQADKIVLSRVLTLEAFGYYSLASVVGTAFAAMNGPVFNAMFPRLTALIAARAENVVEPLFRLASQGVAVLILPAAIVIAAFSFEILLVWTRDAAVARNTAELVSVLILGCGLNSLMNLPYALQLAHGLTRIAFVLNLMLAITIVPALLIVVTHYGALGAAWVWTTVNLAYVVLGVSLTHRRLFRDSGWYWYADAAAILGAAILVVIPWRVLFLRPLPLSTTVLVVLGAGLTSTAAAGAVSARFREWTVEHLTHRFGRLA